ncbi:hypothetical protein ACVVIH_07005 [Chryseobacterium arthrosphaerae]
MNLQAIKSGTKEYYKSDEAYFKERIHSLKKTILDDFEKWKIKHPDKDFSNFKSECLEDLKQWMQYLDQILYIGVIITALDEVSENNL